MDLESQSFHGEVKFMLQLVGNAHADVAEGSDSVGKDLHADARGLSLLFITLIEHGYGTGFR
jgi:hypothetical protein